MKKFIILFSILCFTCLSANAKTLRGKVVGEISTYYPKETITIEVTKNITLKNTEFKKGYLVVGTMTEVKSPEKKDSEASFVFTITKYRDLDGIYYDVKDELSTTYKQKSPFDVGFFKDTDISFMPSMPMQTDTGLGGNSAQSYKNVNIKPMSIVNSLMPEEYRSEEASEMDYRSAMPNDKDDILLLDGDRIKFEFPDK